MNNKLGPSLIDRHIHFQKTRNRHKGTSSTLGSPNQEDGTESSADPTDDVTPRGLRSRSAKSTVSSPAWPAATS